MNNRIVFASVTLFVFVLAGAGCTETTGRIVPQPVPVPAEVAQTTNAQANNEVMPAGSYEVYAPEKIMRAAEGKVVLFFRASWCPTCRGLDTDIKTHLGDIPNGVTILDVNYDDSEALQVTYGVTYQHTLVQVDADGTRVAKWTGSPTLAELLSHIK